MGAEAKKKLPVKKSPAKLSLPKKVSLDEKKYKKSNVSVLKLPRPSLVAQLAPRPADANKLAPRLQAVVDKSEIQTVVATFARGLDRLDENLLRSVLHADATLDLGPGVFQGTSGDYVHWILSVLHGVKSSHHMVGNLTIELEGDTALVETYFHTHFRLDKPVGREDVFMGGRYLDRMERRPAGAGGIWKIMHRKQAFDWVRTEAVSDIFYHQNPDALWTARSKTDPSSQMAQFPGSQPGGKLPAFLGRRYEAKSMKF